MTTVAKRIIAAALTLVLFSCAVGLSAVAQAVDANDCDCGHTPTLVIPGIFQSQVRYYDENGNEMTDSNGKALSEPFFIDTKNLITSALKKGVLPIMMSLLLQHDVGLSSAICDVACEALGINANDSNGNTVNDVRADKYLSSVATCTQAEKDHIYRSIPLEGFSAIAGEDHLYFYSYNSLGNLEQNVAEIYALINTMIEETGHEKVNIVPISMGGALANALLDYYPDVMDKLDRVVYIIPALDGSDIVGDVYSGNLSTSNEMLYDELFPSLMNYDYTGYLVNIALRLLPKHVVLKTLDKTLEGLTNTLLLNCTMLWALVPSNYYVNCAKRLLSDPAQAEIKRQTDRYYLAQMNSDTNIKKLVSKGVEVFDVVDYNQLLYKITPSWSEVNSDGIIQCDSTSMGATFGNYDTPLPEGYVQKNTHCSNPGHNHISPDRIVDASTGLLPDHTFYFYNQNHESTGKNDVIMRLAVELLLDDSFTDVYSRPEEYPQFNVGRDGRALRNLIADANRCLTDGKVTGADAQKLRDAIAPAQAHYDKTNINIDEYNKVTADLQNTMIELGLRNPPEDKSKEENLKKIFKGLSDFLYKYWGPRGFSDFYFEKFT